MNMFFESSQQNIIDKPGFLASITQHIRDSMFEFGIMKQADLEQEVLSRLGMLQDEQKHNTVKRRIYDALSTFLALNILQKQDKTLYWRGFPNEQPQQVQSVQNSPSVSNEPNNEDSQLSDTSNNYGITEDFIMQASQEQLQQKIDEINAEINQLESKIQFHDYFLNKPQSDGDMIHLPFTVCATRESKNAVVLPQNAEQSTKNVMVIMNKENVTVMTHQQIINQLIELQE